MSSLDDQNYNEIIKLFMEFRKMEDDGVALGYLQGVIKNKIRDDTRGATHFSELKDGERFIILPMNGFDCCRNSGMRFPEGTYVLLEKYTTDGKEKAKVVSTGNDHSTMLFDLVLKVL